MSKHISKSGEVEARLDRALGSQIQVPQLDRRFDSAVWARIKAEESPATNPVLRPEVDRSARWLRISNWFGALVTIALVVYFGLQLTSGIEVNLAVPEVSESTVANLVKYLSWPVTGLALFVGLMFTSFGRKLRSEFS
jgi:hypothetical protein